MSTQNCLKISDILYGLSSSEKALVFSGTCPLCNSILLKPGISSPKFSSQICSTCHSVYISNFDFDFARRLPIDDTSFDKNLAKGDRLNILFTGFCPDCGCDRFIPGPRAGFTVNIQCFQCGSKFNISYIIYFAERI